MKTDPGFQTFFPWFEGQQELAPIDPPPTPPLPEGWDTQPTQLQETCL